MAEIPRGPARKKVAETRLLMKSSRIQVMVVFLGSLVAGIQHSAVDTNFTIVARLEI